GRVSKMELLEKGKFRVDLRISSSYSAPSNIFARMVSTDLLGSKAIVIDLGNSPTLANDVGVLLSDVQPISWDKLEPLQNKIENLVVKFDSVLSGVNSALNDEFQRDFKSSLRSISASLNNIENITNDVESLMGTEKMRLANIMQNLESIT